MDCDLPSALWLPLGGAITRARTALGLSLGELAERVDASPDVLAAIEEGERRAPRTLVEQIDAAVGTGGSLRSAWASALESEAFPRQFRDLAGLEAHATRIWEHQLMVVPEFLRTREYAHAVLAPAHHDTPAEEIERWVDDQMRRRATLTGPGAPRLRVVLNESVLRRPQGGARVLNGQRDTLARLISEGAVEVRIIPDAAPHHPGLLGGAFRLMSFAGRPSLGYAFHAVGGRLVDPDEVDHFEQLVTAIEAASEPLAADSLLLTERYGDDGG